MSYELYHVGDVVRLRNPNHIKNGEKHGAGMVVGYLKTLNGRDCLDTPMVAWSGLNDTAPALWSNITRYKP